MVRRVICAARHDIISRMVMMGVGAVTMRGRVMMMRMRMFGRACRFGGGELHLQHVAVMDGDREDERRHRHEGNSKGYASQAVFQPVIQHVGDVSMGTIATDSLTGYRRGAPATSCHFAMRGRMARRRLAGWATKDHPAAMFIHPFAFSGSRPEQLRIRP